MPEHDSAIMGAWLQAEYDRMTRTEPTANHLLEMIQVLQERVSRLEGQLDPGEPCPPKAEP